MATNRVLRSSQTRNVREALADTETVTHPHKTFTTASELNLSPIAHGKRKREDDAQLNHKVEGQRLSTRRRTTTRTNEASKAHGRILSSSSKPSKRLPRPTAPHVTNAPLITPKGSRVLALPLPDQDSRSRKSIVAKLITSTANVLSKACTHLIQTDTRMRPLIEAYSCDIFSPEGLAEECEPFKTIASGIMGQQVSGAAASSIKRKFVGLFQPPKEQTADGFFPSPHQVADCTVSFLRQAGLSERKAEYIKVSEDPRSSVPGR